MDTDRKIHIFGITQTLCLLVWLATWSLKNGSLKNVLLIGPFLAITFCGIKLQSLRPGGVSSQPVVYVMSWLAWAAFLIYQVFKISR